MWNVGEGNSVRPGDDSWVGCDENFKLLRNMVDALRTKGFFLFISSS
jgi:hypothetical protein